MQAANAKGQRAQDPCLQGSCGAVALEWWNERLGHQLLWPNPSELKQQQGTNGVCTNEDIPIQKKIQRPSTYNKTSCANSPSNRGRCTGILVSFHNHTMPASCLLVRIDAIFIVLCIRTRSLCRSRLLLFSSVNDKTQKQWQNDRHTSWNTFRLRCNW